MLFDTSDFYASIKNHLSSESLSTFHKFIQQISKDVDIPNKMNFLLTMSDLLSSLDHSTYTSWVSEKYSGICHNVCVLLTRETTYFTHKHRSYVYDIISKLSFLFYLPIMGERLKYEAGTVVVYPIPHSIQKWTGEQLDMRILFAHWLSQQITSYSEIHGTIIND